MKKILLATTVLVGTAGFAAAEVSLSGDGRMGVISESGGDVQLTSRARVKFTMSGESDNGLAFGASFRGDNAGNAASGTAGSVSLSGAFGKIEMGDTGNAADALVGQVSGVGLTGLGDHNEITWLDKDLTGAMYSYSTGGLTFGAGTGQLDGDLEFASVAVKYATDAYSVALGYETNSEYDSQISALVSATMSGATVKLKLAQATDYDSEYALSVDYGIAEGTTVTAFLTDGYHDNADEFTGTSYGVGVSHDLGGGATLVGGYVVGQDNGEQEDGSFDFGVSFAF